jgi:hypothetical protein
MNHGYCRDKGDTLPMQHVWARDRGRIPNPLHAGVAKLRKIATCPQRSLHSWACCCSAHITGAPRGRDQPLLVKYKRWWLQDCH